MAQIGTLKTFTTKQDPIPSADFNTNFTAIKTSVNSIDQTQIAAGSTIVLSTAATTISGVYTFTANPVFNARGIADAALSANVPLLNGTQTFTGTNTFDNAIEKLKVPILATHPTTAAYNNSIYEYSGDGNIYVYKHGTGAVRADYTGTYTGGALRPYSGMQAVDENTPLFIMFKCDAGFSSVKLNLVGKDFPSYIYTELPQHTHAFGTLALADGTVTNTAHTHPVDLSHNHGGTFASSAHTHDINAHDHNVGTLAGTTATHNHGGNTGDYLRVSSNVGAHKHTISTQGALAVTLTGTSQSKSLTTNAPSATASTVAYSGSVTSGAASYTVAPSVATTISGSTATAGILGNTLNTTKKVNVTDAIKLYITTTMASWGAAKDKVTYAALANINNSNGTGDIDITSACSTGYNYIKVVDETANKGGTIMWHLETS